ncbi:MAG TPA: radical SAM protein [Nitrospirota bacterium]
MLLIFPPVAKPSEPPAGIAKLSGALRARGVSCGTFDANLEGLLWLLEQPKAGTDTWTRRAIRNVQRNIAALRHPRTYESFDRYNRAVLDVQRVLEAASGSQGALVGLADYHHDRLSPVRSADLLYAAEHPEQNPFYPWFSKRLPEAVERTFLPLKPQGRDGRQKENGSGDNGSSRMVGFSLNYLSQALTTFAMIGFLRKEFHRLTIVLGGGLVTSWIRRQGRFNPFGGLVDHLIAGPGEKPLLRMLGAADAESIDTEPDYGSLVGHDYLSPGFILPYSGSSGCYWNKCSFCPEKAEGNPYAPVPAAKAMSDLGSLTAKWKPVMVHLLDNAVSPSLMAALAARPHGAPWYGFARIGKDLADLDYCMALRRSGCGMLKLGLESGDQGVLDAMEKGLDLETASRALTNLKRAGIPTYVYLLFGTPVETLHEARKTLQFTVDHAGAISHLNLAVFNMPVCGREAGAFEAEPFSDGDLPLYGGFRHPRGWDRKSVRRFLDFEFKRHPAVSAILRSEPRIFTSNHAALFHRSNQNHT